jgi:hypothetical protein
MNGKDSIFSGCKDGEGLLQDKRDQTDPEHNPESDRFPRTPGVGRTAKADYNDKKHESNGVQYCSDPVDTGELLLIGEIGSRIARWKDEEVNR